MKFLKRVAATPLPKHEGEIIDSFDAVSDKKRNAPSINAVKNYCKRKSDFYVYTSGYAGSNNSPYIEEVLPSGWTVENCVILSVQIGTDNHNPISSMIRWGTPNCLSQYSVAYNAWIQGGRIGIHTNLTGADGANYLRVVLMKV